MRKHLFWKVILLSLLFLASSGRKSAAQSGVASSVDLSSLNTGLIHWWKLNEGLATTQVHDYGSSPAVGTWAGAGTCTVGHYYAGYNRQWAGCFDGSTNYVSTSGSYTPSISAPITLAAWVYAYSATEANSGMIFGNMASSNANGVSLQGYYTSGQCSAVSGFCVRFLLAGSSTGMSVVDFTALSFNAWHLVVGTYDGSQTQAGMRLYVDGQLIPAFSGGSTGFQTPAGEPWILGSTGGHGALVHENIADARVWSRALSGHEVSALYGMPRSPGPRLNPNWGIVNNQATTTIVSRVAGPLASNVGISGGTLNLTVNYVPAGVIFPSGSSGGVVMPATYYYTAAAVVSAKSFQYGTFEVYMKLGGASSHGTFWLLNALCQNSEGWYPQYANPINSTCGTIAANYSEIDVGEQDIGSTTQVGQNWNGPVDAFGINLTSVSNPTTNYHLYSATWSSTQTVFAIDGSTTYTIPCATYGCTAFAVPMNMVLSNMLNSSPGTSYPQTMNVRCVKVYDLSGNLEFDDEFGNSGASPCT